jgi:hypoxanthine phosphoribosyltransferase
LKKLLNHQTIQSRVKELAREISLDYEDRNPVLVCVLKGAFVFLADLLREIVIPVEIDFLSITSYTGRQSSGIVRMNSDLTINIEGRDVLIIEDIIDTGRTIGYILENLKTRKPRSIAICTLLDKNDKRVVDLKLDYVGFEIPSRFVVGYGLDFENKYRNLKHIGVIDGDQTAS